MRGHLWLNKVASVLGPLLRQWLTWEASWRFISFVHYKLLCTTDSIMYTVPY